MDSIFEQTSQTETNSDEPLAQISAAMDEFEGYAHPHGGRIAVIADAIAEKFNFAAHDRQALRQAALVHDLGELVMNREYIKANRMLREDERIDMQRHTVIGEQEAAKRGLSRCFGARTDSACRANFARRRYVCRADRFASIQRGDFGGGSKKIFDRMVGHRVRSESRQGIFVARKSARTAFLRGDKRSFDGRTISFELWETTFECFQLYGIRIEVSCVLTSKLSLYLSIPIA